VHGAVVERAAGDLAPADMPLASDLMAQVTCQDWLWRAEPRIASGVIWPETGRSTRRAYHYSHQRRTRTVSAVHLKADRPSAAPQHLAVVPS